MLKNDFNFVDYIKLPKIQKIDDSAIEFIENEIKNSIIKIGLSSIFNKINFNHIKSNLNKINEKYEKSLKSNEKLNMENEIVISEAKELREENNDLIEEIKRLQKNIDQIKLEFEDFKKRFSNVSSKNLLEFFSLSSLWEELFNEPLKSEDKVIIATNNFKPDNIIIGQGFIGAESKEKAIDWLKIIKTAIIFIDDNFHKMKKEFENLNDDISNDLADDLFFEDENYLKNQNNDKLNKKSNDFENENKINKKKPNTIEYDDMINQFSKFWDE